MKTYIILILLFLTAPALRAQIDTTSGWKVVFTYSASAPGYTLGGLQFPSKDTGYAFGWNGTNGVLFRSTDQGITWDSLQTPLPGDIVFVTALTGYACAHNPDDQRAWKTMDGGVTWVAYDRGSNDSGPFTFASQDTGIVFGFEHNARTTDGGLTWHEVNNAIGLTPNDASFGSATTGYAVGQMTPLPSQPDLPWAGYCEKTNDGGATWNQIYTGIHRALSICYAISNDILYVGTSGGVICCTRDGGLSWDSLRVGVESSDFTAASFADSLHGMMAGALSTKRELLGITTDGGKSWQRYDFASDPLNGVAMLNDSIALCCGGSKIYRTTTGGEPILAVQPQRKIAFDVQVFPNPTSGIVTIQYQLPQSGPVSLRFYDEQGRTISSAAPQFETSGRHRCTYDGSHLASGMYYFELTTPAGKYSGKFTIEK